jgi:predicted transcriptional regulator
VSGVDRMKRETGALARNQALSAEQEGQRRVRWKRFVRPQVLAAFTLTERKLRLLANVARYALISSDDLAQLDGGSVQNAKRELRTLWEHGFVLRPPAQLNTVALTGPRAMVYGLSNKGARLLREHGHHIQTGVDWSENSRRAGMGFIDHSVARSRFMSAVEVAARARPDISVMEASAIIERAPERTRLARHPLKWTAVVPDDRGRDMSASLISDDLFALLFDDDTASYFLVEIDRGQMPVRRNGASAEEIVEGKPRVRTSYRHKLAIYYHGWRQRRHVEQLNIEQLRVLTVTTSALRIETMLGAVRDVTGGKGSDLFLFIDEETLRSTNPLDAVWTTGKGKPARLTD